MCLTVADVQNPTKEPPCLPHACHITPDEPVQEDLPGGEGTSVYGTTLVEFNVFYEHYRPSRWIGSWQFQLLEGLNMYHYFVPIS